MKIGVIGTLLIVGVLAAALVATLGLRLETGGRGVADVNAKTYDLCLGGDKRGAGPANIGVSLGPFPENQIWSTQDVYFSWFKDGKSRPASVEGGIRSCEDVSLPHVFVSDVFYRFSYSENGLNWNGATNDDFPAGQRHVTVDLEQPLTGSIRAFFGAVELTIDGFTLDLCGTRTRGSPDNVPLTVAAMTCDATEIGHQIKDGAALLVEVFAYDRTRDSGPIFFGSDQVNLRDASAAIDFSQEGYVVGETATVRWTSPTATYVECTGSGDSATCVERPAYFYSVYDMNTNTPISGMERVPVGTRTGSKSFEITSDLFSRNLNTCQNRVRAVLYTELVQVAEADSSVADLSYSATQPTVTDLTLSKVDIREGDTVTVTWNVVGNATRIHLTVWLQGINLVDKDLPGSARSYSFQADRSGFGKVMVTVLDRCQPSPTKTQAFAVENVTPGLCDLFPDVAECAARNWTSLLIAVASVIGVFLAFVFVLWVASKVLPEDYVWFALPIAGVAALFVAIAFGQMGWFDGFFTAALVTRPPPQRFRWNPEKGVRA